MKQSHNKYDLVLLDLDGTTADTDEMIIQSMYILYDKYRNGVRTPVEQIYYFSGPPIRDTLAKEFPDMDPDELTKEFADLSYDLYDVYVKPFPHVLEVLENLKKRGIKLGVVTAKQRKATDHCLQIIGMDKYVDFVITFNDVKNLKPNPEGILKCVEHFSILDKKKVLYIGDNTGDYLAGRNAGVDVAMVTWGPRKVDKSITPDYWIDSFKDVEDITRE